MAVKFFGKKHFLLKGGSVKRQFELALTGEDLGGGFLASYPIATVWGEIGYICIKNDEPFEMIFLPPAGHHPLFASVRRIKPGKFESVCPNYRIKTGGLFMAVQFLEMAKVVRQDFIRAVLKRSGIDGGNPDEPQVRLLMKTCGDEDKYKMICRSKMDRESSLMSDIFVRQYTRVS